jgi:hypothetical protein
VKDMSSSDLENSDENEKDSEFAKIYRELS